MTARQQHRGFRVWAIFLVAVGFGLLTIKEGARSCSATRGTQCSRELCTFVLWFNLWRACLCHRRRRLWMQQRWAAWLAIAIAAATALTFAAFGAHVYSGGAYEQRTVIAMSLRTLVWVAIAPLPGAGCCSERCEEINGGAHHSLPCTQVMRSSSLMLAPAASGAA